jgi:hypothetical protein
LIPKSGFRASRFVNNPYRHRNLFLVSALFVLLLVCGLVLRARGQGEAVSNTVAKGKPEVTAPFPAPLHTPSAASFAPRREVGEPGMVAPPNIPAPFRSSNNTFSLLDIDGQFAHESV